MVICTAVSPSLRPDVGVYIYATRMPSFVSQNMMELIVLFIRQICIFTQYGPLNLITCLRCQLHIESEVPLRVKSNFLKE
jgi:hypothetical protein